MLIYFNPFDTLTYNLSMSKLNLQQCDDILVMLYIHNGILVSVESWITYVCVFLIPLVQGSASGHGTVYWLPARWKFVC